MHELKNKKMLASQEKRAGMFVLTLSPEEEVCGDAPQTNKTTTSTKQATGSHSSKYLLPRNERSLARQKSSSSLTEDTNRKRSFSSLDQNVAKEANPELTPPMNLLEPSEPRLDDPMNLPEDQYANRGDDHIPTQIINAVKQKQPIYFYSQTPGKLIPAIVSPKKKRVKSKHQLNVDIINIKTQVVRIRKKKGTTVQNCDIYVGNRCFHGGWQLQESKWANPFEKLPKGESLEKYREYVLSQPKLKDSLIELKGKVLGCFCERHERPCHADVLCELVEEYCP